MKLLTDCKQRKQIIKLHYMRNSLCPNAKVIKANVLLPILLFMVILPKAQVFPQSYKWKNTGLPIEERVKDLITNLTLEEKFGLLRHINPGVPRLGIRPYVWSGEALHGLARFGQATVFPQAIGMAATFDPELMIRVGETISTEGRAKHHAALKKGIIDINTGLTYWSPNVNLFRDPRWGRGQETYGEDPYLTSVMGVNFVKGIQGNHPKYLKAAAAAKHFAAHSGPEQNRHSQNVIASQKDLFESYFPAFEALANADVAGFMCAYNRLNDKPCCGSHFLLKKILRDKWDFKGYIVSDSWALIDMSHGHKVSASIEESLGLAFNNGLTLNSGNASLHVKSAYQQGFITEKTIDTALFYNYKTLFRLGLFDPDSLIPFSNYSLDTVRCQTHLAIAKEAAIKSVVMLKNSNNTLPLKKDIKSVFVTGPMAANNDVLMGNYYGYSPEYNTFLEGIVAKVDKTTRVRYTLGTPAYEDAVNKYSQNVGIHVAAKTQAVIAVLGVNSLFENEEVLAFTSENGDRLDLNLPENQIRYLKKLKEKCEKVNVPVILVLTAGSPIILNEIYDYADAILFAWYPGEMGGKAVADIIFGEASPSGKLPVTFPESMEQLPDFEDYSMQGRTYRFMKDEPFIPFGFGLSYTTFSYSDISINKSEIKKGESVTVTARITNTGRTNAEEVVQMYISDVKASTRVPLFSLKGFQRIRLAPNESKTITFEMKPKMMEIFDNDGNSFIEPGEFKVYIGGSSPQKQSMKQGAAMPLETVFVVK